MSNCNHEQQIAEHDERVSILEIKVNENFIQNNDQDFEKPKKKVPSSKSTSEYSLNQTNNHDVIASPGKRSSSVELNPTEGPSHFIGSKYPVISKKRTSKEAPTVLYENRNIDVSSSHQITNDEINNLMKCPTRSWDPVFFNLMWSTYHNTQNLVERLTKVEDFLGISDEPSNNIQKYSISQQLTQINQILTQLSEKQEELSNDLKKLSGTKEKKEIKIDKEELDEEEEV